MSELGEHTWEIPGSLVANSCRIIRGIFNLGSGICDFVRGTYDFVRGTYDYGRGIYEFDRQLRFW